MTSMIEFHDGGILDMLDKLPAEIHAKAIRPAAQAGAQVLYDEVKMRAPMSSAPHKSGKQTYSPGNLKAAIYQAYSPESSQDGAHVYHVSWNKQKAFYGQFIEYGTVKMAARPFLRPAYDAKKQAALDAAETVLGQKLDEVLNGI